MTRRAAVSDPVDGASGRRVAIGALWDVGEVIDLSGGLHNGMWRMRDPYRPVEITEIPLAGNFNIVEYSVYAQEIRMPVQASTYLETPRSTPSARRWTSYPWSSSSLRQWCSRSRADPRN